MPISNEKLVKSLTDTLAGLATKIEAASTTSAQATSAATEALGQVLGNIAVGGGTPISTPPTGYFKVTNLYVNSEGKLVVAYDDTPTP